MAKSTTVTAAEARENAAALLQFWRAGRESRERLDELNQNNPGAFQRGQKASTLEDESRLTGRNVDTMAKARRIAEEYKVTDINKLCSAIRRHQSRFSRAHLTLLLAVQNRARRNSLTQKAISESWSVRRLMRAVQATKGERRESIGRRPRVPDEPAEALLELDALCDKLGRWCALAQVGILQQSKLPIEKLTEAANEVREAISREIQRLQAKSSRSKHRRRNKQG